MNIKHMGKNKTKKKISKHMYLFQFTLLTEKGFFGTKGRNFEGRETQKKGANFLLLAMSFEKSKVADNPEHKFNRLKYLIFNKVCNFIL